MNIQTIRSNLFSLLPQAKSLGSVIALGIPSYFIFAIASRSLNPIDFTEFVAHWTLINTVLIGAFSSIEAQGPYLRSQMQTEIEFWKRIRSLSKYATVFATIIVLLGLLALKSDLLTWTIITLICVSTYSVWNMERTRLLGRHNLSALLLSSVIFSLLCCIYILLVSYFRFNSSEVYMSSLPFAWLITSITFFQFSSRGEKNKTPPMRNQLEKLSNAEKRRYFILSLSTLFGIFPGAVTLIAAPQILQESADFRSLVGIVLLTRLGLTVLNSVTPTLLISYSKALHTKKEVRKLFIAHNLTFLVGAATASLIFMFLGDPVLGFFMKVELTLSPIEIIALVLGETLLAATVSTKTLLISRGISKSQLEPWILASILYLALISTFRSVLGFGIAAIFAAIVVFVFQGLALKQNSPGITG